MGFKEVSIETIPFLKELQSIAVRQDILARVVRWQLAKRRAGTHSTKEEADVAGSGKKIYKQKGTGNARQGSKRGPHFRGGAVIFGPHPRDHGFSLPKKVRQMGLIHAIASNMQNKSLFVFEDLNVSSPKTKEVLKTFSTHFDISKKILVVDEANETLLRGIRNIYTINGLPSCGLNVHDIIRHDLLVFSKTALEKVIERVS